MFAGLGDIIIDGVAAIDLDNDFDQGTRRIRRRVEFKVDRGLVDEVEGPIVGTIKAEEWPENPNNSGGTAAAANGMLFAATLGAAMALLI